MIFAAFAIAAGIFAGLLAWQFCRAPRLRIDDWRAGVDPARPVAYRSWE